MIDTRPDYSKIRITMSKAIREKCLDCSCWQPSEVRECHIVKCPLWRFRMGKEQRDDLYVKTNRGSNIDGIFRGKTAKNGIVE